MNYKTYRDIRAGHVIRIPAYDGRYLVTYVAKRLRAETGHKITLICINEQDLYREVVNPTEIQIQIGSVIETDPGIRRHVRDLQHVGHVAFKKERHVKFKVLRSADRADFRGSNALSRQPAPALSFEGSAKPTGG